MIDTNAILRVVDEASVAFDATLSEEGRRARDARRNTDVPENLVPYPAGFGEEAMYEFELSTAAEALHTLADEIQAECDRRMAEAYRMALDIFYAAEELSRDPKHAELIPQVEAMRLAHELQYGKPIPEKS